VWNQLDDFVRTEKYSSVEGTPLLPDEQWQAHRAMLARYLDDRIWEWIAPSMDEIPTMRERLMRAGSQERPLSFDDKTVDIAVDLRYLAAEAFKLLTGQPVEEHRLRLRLRGKPGGIGATFRRGAPTSARRQ
jgi:hypothetical protein